MKIVKYIIGFAVLILFFLLIDQSGIGFQGHIKTVREWASGRKKKLHFTIAGQNK